MISKIIAKNVNIDIQKNKEHTAHYVKIEQDVIPENMLTDKKNK